VQVAETPKPYRLRDLTDAKKLAAKRQELESLRQRDKIDWTLNREFYKGNQYSFWNKNWPGGGRLETTGMDEGDKPRYKVRLVVADLQDSAMHYVAQLTKNRPIINGTPDSGSDRDLKAAQMGTSLWEYWWQDMALDAKLQSALLDAALSQGYWHITWDRLAGKLMTFMVSPDGQPLADWSDEDLDIYRDSLRDQGIDPKQFERTVAVGDISVKPIPGENVLLDPSPMNYQDARYAIVIENIDVDELYARYPATLRAGVEPDAVPGPTAANPQGFTSQTDSDRSKTVRRVYHMYVRPGPAMPEGRYVCWIEGPDMILEDGKWEFPFNELPLTKFPGIERPGSNLDIPRMTAARPLAKQLNRTLSQTIEHQNLTLKPQMLAPVGSLQDRLTNEPGRTLYFNPINGAVPQWREIPSLPSYVYTNMDRIEAKLDRLFNRMPTQRDKLPARIDSAGGIDSIFESVADQLTPTIRRLEAALVRGGMLMVKLAQKYYQEPRLLKIKGANGAVQVRKFLNADLAGGFSFNAEPLSGLPRTHAGKQMRIEFMLTNQLIDQRTALRYLDTADMTGLMAKMQAAEEQAYRTLEKLKKGQPLNISAYQQAIAALQQGVNPQTGQPLQSPDEAQQIVLQAMVQPQMHEDPQVHIDVLTQYMSSVEYEKLDPQLQNLYSERLSAMYSQAASIAQAQATMAAPVERPRVALQLKATSSAPVAGEILREAGVQVDDEAVAEPPLETWVTDSIDKPDMDDAGNDPLTQLEQAMSMQQAQTKHVADMAKSAHEVALAKSKAAAADQANTQSAVSHALELRRAEEAHQASLKEKKGSGKSGG